ncbi:MAG: hypothetical protein CMJ48_07685 [Planctomycetaceae bacterium]|nr:hypothetical protein [Planctomycetaceae bacterium]
MLLAMFAIVYVLAIGPLYWQWYAEAHMGEPGWLLLLYAPLETACENSELVNDWVDSYIELWVT